MEDIKQWYYSAVLVRGKGFSLSVAAYFLSENVLVALSRCRHVGVFNSKLRIRP